MLYYRLNHISHPSLQGQPSHCPLSVSGSIREPHPFQLLPLHPLPPLFCVQFVGHVLQVNKSCRVSVEQISHIHVLRFVESTDEWGGAGIDELMLGSSGYNHQIPSLDVLILTSDCRLSDARGERKGLVDRVNLESGVQINILYSKRGASPPLSLGLRGERTSSPMSPPTGTVIRTT